MDKIKDALTRKIGPLPAWAWLGIFGIGYYYYKNHIANNSTSATQASSTVTTPTPQSPITVSPGDSVYNPNTGTLTTAPGGGGGYGGGGGGGGQLANALSNIATALTNLNNNAPNAATSPAPNSSPVPANTLPFRILKTNAKKIVSKRGKPRVKHTPLGAVNNRPRSTAAVHNTTHATKTTRHTAVPHSRTPNLEGARQQFLHERAKTPVVTHTVNAHPVARTQPAHRSEPVHNVRPSAPPKRTVSRRQAIASNAWRRVR